MPTSGPAAPQPRLSAATGGAEGVLPSPPSEDPGRGLAHAIHTPAGTALPLGGAALGREARIRGAARLSRRWEGPGVGNGLWTLESESVETSECSQDDEGPLASLPPPTERARSLGTEPWFSSVVSEPTASLGATLRDANSQAPRVGLCYWCLWQGDSDAYVNLSQS